MNLGQSILAAAALIAITILVISANRLIVQSQQDEYKAIAVNEASEIASAIINEAMSKQFDLYNPSPPTYPDPSNFSDPGPNATEAYNVPLPDTFPFRSIGWYNDFDDYDGYSRTVDTPTIKGYLAKCTVDYVQSSNFTKTTTTKGFFKRIVVTVEHSVYLEPPISFSVVKTY